jgi:hypothetical protein
MLPRTQAQMMTRSPVGTPGAAPTHPPDTSAQMRAAGRKESMLTRTPHAPGTLSRRSQAQRRMRRAAAQRMFCSTNGCTTYLMPDESGRTATCPICGLRRTVRPVAASPSVRLPH